MLVFPNAKINIGLDVTNRRPDGYHDLATIMVPIDWHDCLEAVPSPTPDDRLTTYGRHIDCPPEKNLVMKAVRALHREVDFPPVDVYLEKIIPDGAGLGGGSADCAFTLTALNGLFNLSLDKPTLARIAGKLGADCPIFIYNAPQFCQGIGDVMSPIEIPESLRDMYLLLVKPPVSVTTAQAYAGVVPTPSKASIPEVFATADFGLWRKFLVNAFEPSVFALLPRLREIKERLYGCGALYASMSGSGSTIYGLFPTKKEAEKAAQPFTDCTTRVCLFGWQG